MSFSIKIIEDINWQIYCIVGSFVHHNNKPVIQQGNYSISCIKANKGGGMSYSQLKVISLEVTPWLIKIEIDVQKHHMKEEPLGMSLSLSIIEGQGTLANFIIEENIS